MKEYDVVIAGAGPAGLSAAAELSKYDVKTLLLEKNKIGETEKTWSDFPKNIDRLNLNDAIMHRSKRVIQRAYTGLDLITEAEMVFLEDTKVLDILRSRVDEMNVDIYGNCDCYSFNNQNCILNSSRGEIKTKLLIDATGYKSQGELNSLEGLTFNQFGLEKDILLQTFAAVCEDTNINQEDSIMFDLPFATKERVWYWVNPLGEKRAWLGAMYLTKNPLPWQDIRKGLKRYAHCKGIEFTKVGEKKGFIPSFRLENKIHRDHVLQTGDLGPGAVPGTFFGFVSSIEHGEHVAKMAIDALEAEDYSKESFWKQEESYRDSKTMLNYLLGVVGEKVITPASDYETSNLLGALADCGDEIMIKRLETDLSKKDVKNILKALNKRTSLKEKIDLIPPGDFWNLSKYLFVLMRYYFLG